MELLEAATQTAKESLIEQEISTYIISQQGYQDGYCYHQDVEQGMRWNTDACVSIYIMSSEDGEKPADPMDLLGIEVEIVPDKLK